MKIYISSRGLERDYNWVNVSKSGLAQSESPLTAIILETGIDPDYFSLVIKREASLVYLGITALEGGDRRDSRNRLIKNSICYVGENRDDEKSVRQIAADTLRGNFKDKIKSIISSEAKNNFGFDINSRELEKIIASLPSVSSDSPPNPHKILIHLDSEENRISLAEDLERYELPKDNSYLVVVSKFTSKYDLEKLGVWRGLSGRNDKDNTIANQPLGFCFVNLWLSKVFPCLRLTAPIIALTIVIYFLVRSCGIPDSSIVQQPPTSFPINSPTSLTTSSPSTPISSPSTSPTTSSLPSSPKSTPSPIPTSSPSGNAQSSDFSEISCTIKERNDEATVTLNLKQNPVVKIKLKIEGIEIDRDRVLITTVEKALTDTYKKSYSSKNITKISYNKRHLRK